MRRTRWTTLVVGIAAIVFAAGCGSADHDEPVHHRVERPLGEPEDGYPTWGERLVFYLTNKARANPDFFREDKPHEPSPPLRWDHALGDAARWQSKHIAETGCWCSDHSSCCNIQKKDGSVTCANTAGSCGGTTAAKRVSFWSDQYSGENAAKGHNSPQSAFQGWVESTPHWRNINNGTHQLLGVGQYDGAYVQDFGRGARPPVITGGIHFPDEGSTTFGLNYFQPETGGPQEAMVVVDGECHDLELANGEPERGAYEATVPLDEGCQHYYFHVTDGNGDYHTYPSQGSLGAGNDRDECPLYRQSRPADSCSPSGQPCETGDTRPCYTGPYGTEGVGVCEAGTERCVGGSWTRTCRYEVRPDSEETCGNGTDDDCDGEVDEECGSSTESDTGLGGDAAMDDASMDSEPPSRDGCASTPGELPNLPALAAVLVCVALLRRTNRTGRRAGRK